MFIPAHWRNEMENGRSERMYELRYRLHKLMNKPVGGDGHVEKKPEQAEKEKDCAHSEELEWAMGLVGPTDGSG